MSVSVFEAELVTAAASGVDLFAYAQKGGKQLDFDSETGHVSVSTFEQNKFLKISTLDVRVTRRVQTNSLTFF